MNPDKFQFAKREVDFASFCITDTSIEPQAKFLDAIRDFLTPTSTTDIHCWFGLYPKHSKLAEASSLKLYRVSVFKINN